MSVALKRKRRGTGGPPLKRIQKTVAGEVVDQVNDQQNDHVDEDSPKHSPEQSEDDIHDDIDIGEPMNLPSTSKLPSASELRVINEARDLYKNNAFKTQLELLLKNVRPNGSYVGPLERTLQNLYTHLTSLPSVSPVHPLEASDTLLSLISKKEECRLSEADPPFIRIPYPLPLPPRSTAWEVAFKPPGIVNVVGSWSDSLAILKNDGSPFGVDVIVEMPADLFQEKDYRNSRFFYKRAFYLACIAASLARSPFNFTVEYEAAEGDVRLTTLLLSSSKVHDFSNLNATIRIIPVVSDDVPIPLHRLSPAQSNIRHVVTLPGEDDQRGEHVQAKSQPATPHYNNALALSFARTSRIRLTGAHKLVGMVPSFADALALLRVWANQRGFGAGFVPARGKGKRNYCVRGFEGLGAWWACLLEVLILGEESLDETGSTKGKRRNPRPVVGRGLSSYQLFRAALDFLARHDFEHEPIFMKVVNGQKFARSEWKTHYEAVFVDATGTVNLLSGVPACSLQLLRHDAASTLKLLNTPDDSFASVFLTDMREPHARFDTVIRVSLADCRQHMSLDFSSTQAATFRALVSTIRKALNIRAHAVVPLQLRSLPYPATTAQPAPYPTLILGIIFNSTQALRLVDHGPPASSPEVDAFRAFWGPKAELRRFKDGSIVESCVWDEGIVRVEDREGIPALIVRYILNLHFGIPEEDVCVLAGDYGKVVSAPAVRGRGESGYKKGLTAFEKFVKEVKALEDQDHLPLMLVSAKPCSPSLRYTSVFPPSPVPSSSQPLHPSTSHLPAFDIVLQFERSSMWPDDLRAIQKVKLALFESIARSLNHRLGDTCQARVVLDCRASEIEDGCALEVVLDGWAFHARVGQDREATLLQNMIDEKTKRPGQPEPSRDERQAAREALQVYQRRFIHAPMHHSAILALHHKSSAFAHTVRLVKRWLGAHWLSARVGDEAVELVCALVFSFHEGDLPACGKRGFVRVVEFLKSWKGVAYVPLYEAVREDNTTVTKEHAIEAGKGYWRLPTAEDPSGTIWCESMTIPVANRIRSLAQATAMCLEEGTPTFKPLFEHPMADYDFLIELDVSAVSRYWQGMHPTPSTWNQTGYANLAYSADHAPGRVEFNPAEMFFRDLQRVYGDTMELFYDIHGGTTIGGIWNPSIAKSERHPWRVFLGFSSTPSFPQTQQKKATPVVSFNAKGVLSEIQRMGEGIVKNVTIRE